METLIIQFYQKNSTNYVFLEEANIMEKVKRLGYYSILFSQDSKYLILVSKTKVYEEENFLTILETSSLQKQLQTPLQGFNQFIGITNQFLMYEHQNEYIILNLANGICQKIFLQNEESRLFSFRNNFFVGWLNDELYYLRKSSKKELFSLISINYRQNNKTVLNKIVNGKYNNYNVQSGFNKMIVYNQSMCKIFMFNHLKLIRSINLTNELVYKIIVDEEVYFISVIFVHTGDINYPKIKIIHCLSCQEYTINDASDIYGNNQQFVKPALFLQTSDPETIKIFSYQ